MKLFELLQTQNLFEGGNALKGVKPITQLEVRKYIPELLKNIQDILGLSTNKVKLIGSAGKKIDDEDLSGDLDIAVECDPELVDKNLKELAGKQSSRIMKGIGVFSFATEINDKLVQVDLMPVDNINFAEWSFQANTADIEQGLKGAQRNELFFAIAKNMPQEIMKKKDDEVIEIKRYFYDLGRGLMIGTRSRVNSKGKIGKNFTTVDKKVVTSDPNKIVALMFGKSFTPEQCSTFNGTLNAIKSSKFLHINKLEDILKLAETGIKNKKLKIPDSL